MGVTQVPLKAMTLRQIHGKVEASLTTVRTLASAWVANNKIYAGEGSRGSVLNLIEAYNPTTKVWSNIGIFLKINMRLMPLF